MKPFTWSPSALKNYELCPKKHWSENIGKTVAQSRSTVGDWGSDAHKAIEEYIKLKRPFPLGMQIYKPIVDRIVGWPGQTFAEQKMAVSRDYRAVGYFDTDVWFRAIFDAAKHNGAGMVLVDWKFGKLDEAWRDQGLVMCMAILAQMPDVQTAAVAFVWFKESASAPPISTAVYDRTNIWQPWSELMKRVQRYEAAYVNSDFPAKPNYLCRRYCPVKACPHNGVG